MNFCRKVNMRMLGLVENMSGFVCPKCTKPSTIFPSSSGGAEALSKETDVPLLGRVPLDPRVGRACDEGRSVLEDESAAGSPAVAAYKDIVEKIKSSVDFQGSSG